MAKFKKYKKPRAKEKVKALAIIPPDWETVHKYPNDDVTQRLKVPGGWLYKCFDCGNVTMCYLPDFRVRDRQGEIFTLLSMVLKQRNIR